MPPEQDDDLLPSGYRRSECHRCGATDGEIEFWGLDQPGAPPPEAAGAAVWDLLDELDADGWELVQAEGSHRQRGFALACPVLQANGVIQTCCLKTHRYGGHFTMSLKSSIRLVAKRFPGERHDYMRELHGSPHQRLMIAEVNQPISRTCSGWTASRRS